MLTHNYSYEGTLADSLKNAWQVQDLIGGEKRLDFTKPFLPESLARVSGISCLSDREKLLLNQIRGFTYVGIFVICEQFVLSFTLDETRNAISDTDPHEMRALVRFSDEEAKHIHMFRKFMDEFTAGFGTPCGMIGPAAEIGKFVLSHSRLGVALLTLCLEWMTLTHYVDSIKDNQELDPLYKDMYRHHWMEEAQHAKLDVLLVDKLAKEGGPEAIAKGFADFAALGTAIDGLLQQQVQLDIASLEAASGRTFSESERQEIAATQLRANRYTFLVSGLERKHFLNVVDQLIPGAAEQVSGMARMLSA